MTASVPIRRKAVDVAADSLREGILRGRFPAGGTLPPERDLAQQVGVSRLTLRSAIARLESEGLLKPMHGSGTRVQDFRSEGGVELLGPMLALALEGGAFPLALLKQILEMRRLLAVEALGLATQRARAGELAELRAHLGHQATLVDEPRAFMEADLQLARAVIRAADSLPLELLYNSIARTMLSQPGLETLFAIGEPRRAMAFYDRIFTLLQAGNPEATRRTTHRVLREHDRRLLERLDQTTPRSAHGEVQA